MIRWSLGCEAGLLQPPAPARMLNTHYPLQARHRDSCQVTLDENHHFHPDCQWLVACLSFSSTRLHVQDSTSL